MFYHIQITSKIPRHDHVRLDLTWEQLSEAYIQPYNEGTSLFIDGRIITPDNIERVYITQSEQPSSEQYDIVQQDLERQRKSRNLVETAPIEWYILHRGKNITNQVITGPPPTIAEGDTSVSQVENLRNVWVVHGRNQDAKEDMFTFLRSLDLHPLEWSEAVIRSDEGSPYIGKVLNVAFSQAQAFVILLSGDDEGKLRNEYHSSGDPPFETTLTPQARQNVIFEAGMAFGLYPRRTIIVELGELRPFSNVAGRHVVRINNTTQRRQELAQRLQSAGCPVNLNGTDWHTAGDFNSCL